jgi:CheY-like chemotaxis protein
MQRRVLVIDDDAQTRTLVTALLEPAGYAVRSADGAVAGLGLADAELPDLVVLDVQMPGMDGYEVCRRLRAGPRTQRIPIIMLTASDDPGLNRQVYAAGAQACVPKPFRREGLVATIEAVLAGRPREEPTVGG